MFLDLLIAPLTAPITGLTWIAEKVLDQASTELDLKGNLTKQLLALQLAFDLGEIPEAEFEIREEELLLAIQALEDQKADSPEA
jgi:hypothetical protein